MQKKLLPDYSKILGFTAAIGSLFAIIFSESLIVLMPIDETAINWIFKDLLLISLMIMVFSKEKEESSFIQELRSQGLKYAVGFGAVVLLFDSTSMIFYGNDPSEMKSGYELMLMMLIYYLISFYIKKTKKNPAETKQDVEN